MLLSNIFNYMLYCSIMEYYLCGVFLFLQVTQHQCQPQDIIWRRILSYKRGNTSHGFIIRYLLDMLMLIIFQGVIQHDLFGQRFDYHMSIVILHFAMKCESRIVVYHIIIQLLIVDSTNWKINVCAPSGVHAIIMNLAFALPCVPMLVFLFVVGVEFTYQDHLSMISSYLHIL